MSRRPHPAKLRNKGHRLPEMESMEGLKWLALISAGLVFLLISQASPMAGMVLAPLGLGIILLRLVLYVWLSPQKGEAAWPGDPFRARLATLSRNRLQAHALQSRAKD
jgi:hypothetical protein